MRINPGEGPKPLSFELCGENDAGQVCRREQVWGSHVSQSCFGGGWKWLRWSNICRQDVSKCEARYKCDMEVILKMTVRDLSFTFRWERCLMPSKQLLRRRHYLCLSGWNVNLFHLLYFSLNTFVKTPFLVIPVVVKGHKLYLEIFVNQLTFCTHRGHYLDV